MAPLRRHLASLGLAVVLCHTAMQVLVPAALCCQKPEVGSKARAEAHECCPAGSHPGQICPMHAKNAKDPKKTGDECSASPLVDLHDMLMTLSSGGIVPPLASFAVALRSEITPSLTASVPSFVATAPPGPPPRA